MYEYDVNGLPLTLRKRRKDNFEYFHVAPYDTDEFEDRYYVYCHESNVLIVCYFGLHWFAVQEHVADYVEAKGWYKVPFEDDFSVSDIAHLSDEQIADIEKFISGLELYPIHQFLIELPVDYFKEKVEWKREWEKKYGKEHLNGSV